MWPQVCGHEIVGIVTQVGNAVTHLKPGQRCGVGWQCSSCHDCEWCLRGNEQLCGEVVCTCCEGNRGGFANLVRIKDASFAFNIPKNLDSAEVAPLLCGGQTVWTPLKEQTKPGDRVGILGLVALDIWQNGKSRGWKLQRFLLLSQKRENQLNMEQDITCYTQIETLWRAEKDLWTSFPSPSQQTKDRLRKFFHLLRPLALFVLSVCVRQ